MYFKIKNKDKNKDIELKIKIVKSFNNKYPN